jgi:hypothetical protein
MTAVVRNTSLPVFRFFNDEMGVDNTAVHVQTFTKPPRPVKPREEKTRGTQQEKQKVLRIGARNHHFLNNWKCVFEGNVNLR